jgi:Glycosyl transferase family 2
MTLVARDEEDIIDDNLRYHYACGVDFVIATDHRSTDGTTDVLRQYEREGQLHLIRESAEQFDQPAWVTRMARLAATDFGAEWVINCYADEFWWPREVGLREILEAVPPRFGALWGFWRNFVPRPVTPEPFYERMVIRRLPVADILSPFGPSTKTVHRASPDVVVMGGNHKAFGRSLVLLHDWLPFEIFHFPIRSSEQMTRKYPPNFGRHALRIAQMIAEKGSENVFSGFLVDDDASAQGIADGSLAVDVRLRDVLRSTAGVGSSSGPPPGLDEDLALAQEFGVFEPADSPMRLHKRIGELKARTEAIERRAPPAPARILRRQA